MSAIFAQVWTLANNLVTEKRRKNTLDRFMDILQVYDTVIVKRLDSKNVVICHPFTTNPNSTLGYYHLDLDTLIKTKINEDLFKQYVSIASDPTLNN